MTDEQMVSENMDKGVSMSASEKPRDEFWGGFVFAILVAGSVAAVGFFLFLGYRAYERYAGDAVSIADLSTSVDFSPTIDPESVEDSEKPEENVVPAPVAVTDAKKVSITVLNGSGTKGAAGTLAEFLKKEGYSEVSAGNADQDYSGVTVFYQDGRESVAESVLADVAKKYPKATVSKADSGRKETGTSPITVILGK